MSGHPDTIAGAGFLAAPSFRRVVAAIARDGDGARAVGGAIRNTLLGEPVEDVDIATSAPPDVVMARARAAGLHAVPTGIDHGTVTLIADHVGYEVTTLRADTETDGRRAVVAFTRDWDQDAARRDFTMNAIYADADGRLHDPMGGVADALARRVRFILDPETRIREDYLRILRFFRFHARYGNGRPDEAGLSACVALQEGLDRLSRERIGQEFLKLLAARGAPQTVALMAETGILTRVIGHGGRPDALARIRADGAGSVEPTVALAVLSDADGEVLQASLKLANREREFVDLVRALAGRLGPVPGTAAVKEAVYRHGNAAVSQGLRVAAALAAAPLPETFKVASEWTAPQFPVRGRDLIAGGMPPGPEVGRRLAELEAAWIAGGFGEDG